MSFLAKIFGAKKKKSEPMRGIELPQSQDQIDHTRANMEAEMAADRERRGQTAEQKPETK
jgi:hypothetical protein